MYSSEGVILLHPTSNPEGVSLRASSSGSSAPSHLSRMYLVAILVNIWEPKVRVRKNSRKTTSKVRKYA